MPGALKALTVRGRAFLASGISAVLCGLVLLERDLTRMGLLLVALPLIAAAYVAGRSHHLKAVRTLAPAQLRVGESARVTVELRNEGAATSVLLLEERLPYALGGRPRFVVPPMPRDGRQLVEYSVRPELRGRYSLGPMQVRLRDPFGMVELREQLVGDAQLLVTPRVTKLAEIRLGGRWFASGEDHPRSFTLGRVADVVVREYRRGDDLRRVHWRSTARMGELMVRNEEQLWQARATVVLDNRAIAHRGSGPGSSLEDAVTAAASVVVHLAALGYQVRLVTSSGMSEVWHERGRPLDPSPLLEQLAVLEQTDDRDLPDLSLDEETSGGITVGILGAVRVEDRGWWSRLPGRSSQCLAIALDVEGWGYRDADTGPAPSVSWLTSQGWRATSWRKTGSLAASWRSLDR